jgi:opacity protein-like surface antigen
MKRFLFVAVLIVLISGTARAQVDYPKVELFGGYSLLKLELPADFAQTIGIPATTLNSKFLNQGFNVSAAENLSEYLGIVIDFRYNQGELLKTQDIDSSHAIKIKSLSAMAGPRFTWRKNEILTPFVHAMAGMDYWRLVDKFEVMGNPGSYMVYDFGIGAAVGGGVDVTIHEKVSVRLIQADYYATRHGDKVMSNINLAFGLVFRLGAK